MPKSLNVSKINPDDYNYILSLRHLLIHENNLIFFYSTAYKFPKQIFEPVAIMPINIAHNSVDTHGIDN